MRQAAVIGGVAMAHLGLFFLISRSTPVVTPAPLPPIMVELFEPPEPPPEPPPLTVSPVTGGGAPAAPSRVNIIPDPPEVVPEIIAPPEQAPEPDPIVVGVAPIASPEPGLGQDGEGTGSGSGVGDGDGPGSGGTPPRLVRGPSIADLRRLHPPAALRAGVLGEARINCEIGLDTRLSDCRLVDERPAGRGFGEAGLRAAEVFRFQPPTRGGRPVSGQRVTFGVNFGPPPRR